MSIIEVIAKINSNQIVVSFVPNNSKSISKFSKINNLNVLFTKTLTINSMKYMYKNSTLLFFSKAESFALPLYEAKSLGGRVITTDLYYSNEALYSYQNKVVISLDNHYQLKEAILNELSK